VAEEKAYKEYTEWCPPGGRADLASKRRPRAVPLRPTRALRLPVRSQELLRQRFWVTGPSGLPEKVCASTENQQQQRGDTSPDALKAAPSRCDDAATNKGFEIKTLTSTKDRSAHSSCGERDCLCSCGTARFMRPVLVSVCVTCVCV